MQALNHFDFLTNKLLDCGPMLNYRFLSVAYTVEKMTLWEFQYMDSYETRLFRGNSMPSARVEGKLYQLTESEMNELDTSRGVGVLYHRKHLPVMLPNGDTTFAYMHVAKKYDGMDFDINAGRMRLAPHVPDNNRIIHNRFTIVPPPIVAATPQKILPIIERYCGERNDAAIRSARWEAWKRKVKNFIE